MNNISTGFGLCVLGLGVALWPVMDRFAPSATAAHAGVPIAVISAAAMGQAAPTIVWYGVVTEQYRDPNGYTFTMPVLIRSWSDGVVEAKQFKTTTSLGGCGPGAVDCATTWFVISNPAQGYSAASDSNFDAKVDGADLALLLGSWGDAPRHDIPPSDCPLNLINP